MSTSKRTPEEIEKANYQTVLAVQNQVANAISDDGLKKFTSTMEVGSKKYTLELKEEGKNE